MKKVTILIGTPSDLYFASEIEVQCHNFRKFGYSSILQVVVHGTEEDKYKEYWDKLAAKYKEVKFFFYTSPAIEKNLKIYPPFGRPWSFKKHWEAYPELKNHVIIYLDSDVIFTRHLDFSKYINDDICYMSKTPYVGAKYFYSKEKDVLPFMKSRYKMIDPLEIFCNQVGIDKQVVIDNEENTGGCQYILKGIDADFWASLSEDCLKLRIQSQSLNSDYFANEERGFQSWAIGDMCGLLWNLWKRGKETRCPEELGFSWSSSPIEEYEKHAFFHNAGVPSRYMEKDGKKHLMFYKSDVRFRTSMTTFFDLEYEGLSKDFCSYKYVEAIKEVEDPVCKTNIKQY